MSGKKKRRRKLEKQMKKRELKNSLAVVICVGKKCCDRGKSRAVLHAARDYAEARHPDVRIAKVGCLHVCKKGPIAASYPEIEIHKRVDADDVRALIDEVAG